MAERHVQRVHTQEVVLDIGDGMGAVVFHTLGHLHGHEIEVIQLDEHATKIHCEVDERSLNGRTVFAGVFPPLPAGDYRVCRPQPRANERFTVVSGQVTEIDWRD